MMNGDCLALALEKSIDGFGGLNYNSPVLVEFIMDVELFTGSVIDTVDCLNKLSSL